MLKKIDPAPQVPKVAPVVFDILIYLVYLLHELQSWHISVWVCSWNTIHMFVVNQGVSYFSFHL